MLWETPRDWSTKYFSLEIDVHADNKLDHTIKIAPAPWCLVSCLSYIHAVFSLEDVVHDLILASKFKAQSHNTHGLLVLLISCDPPCVNITIPCSTTFYQKINGSIWVVRIPYCFSAIFVVVA